MAEGPGTVDHRSLLADAVGDLSASGLPSAEVDARRILECALGVPGPELALHLGEPATTGTVARVDAMVARRRTAEPLQYVLGEWSFRTLDLMVDRRVLIPRPETEVVVGRALDLLAGLDVDEPKVVDLGTGSGAIALSLAAECAGAQVIATDNSTGALEVARANLAGIGRAAVRVRLLKGSWFDALPTELAGDIDLIVSNPPYVGADEDLPAEVIGWEPTEALIAGPTGTEALEHLVSVGLDWLRPGGWMVLELSPDQVPAATDWMRIAGYDDSAVSRDLAGRERVITGRAPITATDCG